MLAMDSHIIRNYDAIGQYHITKPSISKIYKKISPFCKYASYSCLRWVRPTTCGVNKGVCLAQFSPYAYSVLSNLCVGSSKTLDPNKVYELFIDAFCDMYRMLQDEREEELREQYERFDQLVVHSDIPMLQVTMLPDLFIDALHTMVTTNLLNEFLSVGDFNILEGYPQEYTTLMQAIASAMTRDDTLDISIMMNVMFSEKRASPTEDFIMRVAILAAHADIELVEKYQETCNALTSIDVILSPTFERVVFKMYDNGRIQGPHASLYSRWVQYRSMINAYLVTIGEDQFINTLDKVSEYDIYGCMNLMFQSRNDFEDINSPLHVEDVCPNIFNIDGQEMTCLEMWAELLKHEPTVAGVFEGNIMRDHHADMHDRFETVVRAMLMNSKMRRERTIHDIYEDMRRETPKVPIMERMLRQFRELKSNFQVSVEQEAIEYIIKVVEDIITSLLIAGNFSSPKNIMTALLTLVKLRMGNDPLLSFDRLDDTTLWVQYHLWEPINKLFIEGMVPQDSLGEQAIQSVRDFFDNYEAVISKPFFKKIFVMIFKVITFCLTQEQKIEFSESIWAACVPDFSSKVTVPELLYATIDALSFIVQRVMVAMREKDPTLLLDDGTMVSKYIKDCSEIIRQSKFLINPGDHGILLPVFERTLYDLLKRAPTMLKIASKDEKKAINSMMAQMKDIQQERLGLETIMAGKEMPWTLLVFSGSGCAKTMFCEWVRVYICRKEGWPTGDEFTFVNTPGAKHMTGIRSDTITFIQDDAGTRPENGDGKATDDREIILRFINNACWIPEQAALDDKGKIPIRCFLGFWTTNDPTLGVHHTKCPLAYMRRFSMHIELQPKPEYAKSDAPDMIDPQKLPPADPDVLPDYWIITVRKAVPAAQSSGNPAIFGTDSDVRMNQKYKLVMMGVFDSFADFLAFAGKEHSEHRRLQRQFMDVRGMAAKGNACNVCHLPMKSCVCLEQQAHFTHDEGTSWFFPMCAWFYIVVSLGVALPYIQKRCKDYWRKWKLFLMATSSIATGEKLEQVGSMLSDSTNPEEQEIAHIVKWGQRVHLMTDKKWLKIVGGIVFMAGIIAILCGLTLVIKQRVIDYRSVKVKQDVNEPGVKTTDNEIPKDPEDQQVSIVEIERALAATKPIPSSKPRPNAWPKPDHQMTRFDLGSKTVSWSKMSPEEVCARVRENIVKVKLKSPYGNGYVTAECYAYGVCDHMYVLNQHSFKEHEKVEGPWEITWGVDQPNISLKRTTVIRKQDMYRVANDVVAVFCTALPPVANMIQLFSNHPLNFMCDGFLMKHNPVIVRAIELKPMSCQLGVERIGYVAAVDEPTVVGDCGLPYIGFTPKGPVLLGIHSLGRGCVAAFDPILIPLLVEARKILSPITLVEKGGINLGEYQLVEPHGKTPAFFLEQARISLVGSVDRRIVKYASNLVRSKLASFMEVESMIPSKVIPTKLDTWYPWHLGIVDRVHNETYFHLHEVVGAADDYLQTIRERRTKQPQAYIVDIQVAINGLPEMNHMHHLDFNTSMGFPRNVGKKQYLIGTPGNHSFTPEILQEVADILECYKRGERYNPIFTASLKDEVVKPAKDVQGKYRVFMGAPTPWVIAFRMLFLWFVEDMQNDPLVYESAAAINCESIAWDQLFQYITQQSCNAGAGDYGLFDAATMETTLWGVSMVVTEIAMDAGATPDHIKMMQVAFSDLIYPLIHYWTTIVIMPGVTCSGVPLTLLINCMKNSILFRCVFKQVYPDRKFSDYVKLATMGDDNIFCVHPDAQEFNMITLHNLFKERGIDYTTDSKEVPTNPYMSVNDITFVKRRFVRSEEYGCMVCPIEEQSIFKAMFYRDSKSPMGADEHAYVGVCNALRQYAKYPRSKYSEMQFKLRRMISSAVNAAYIKMEIIDLSYDYYVSEWKKNSKGVNLGYSGWTPHGVLDDVVTKTSKDCVVTDMEPQAKVTYSVDAILNSLERSSKSLFRKGSSWYPSSAKVFNRMDFTVIAL